MTLLPLSVDPNGGGHSPPAGPEAGLVRQAHGRHLRPPLAGHGGEVRLRVEARAGEERGLRPGEERVLAGVSQKGFWDDFLKAEKCSPGFLSHTLPTSFVLYMKYCWMDTHNMFPFCYVKRQKKEFGTMFSLSLRQCFQLIFTQ